jgi:hypothetical protein
VGKIKSSHLVGHQEGNCGAIVVVTHLHLSLSLPPSIHPGKLGRDGNLGMGNGYPTST